MKILKCIRECFSGTSRSSFSATKAGEDVLLYGMSEGAVELDAEGRIVRVNRAAEEMLGWKQEDLRGKKFTEIILMEESGKIIPAEERPSAVAMASGATVATEKYFYKRKDGSMFPASIIAAPISVDQKVVGAWKIFRDIMAEARIEKAKSDFIAIASHQLRTPLAGIRWTVERILRKEKLSDKGVEYLSDLVYSIGRMNELVEMLLNTSRIEAGITIMPQEVEVVGFLEDYINSRMSECTRKGITLTFQKPAKAIDALTDITALRNIVQALISNAIDYTPEGGGVVVSVERQDGSFLIKVADTGIGIPEGYKKRIFQKFARAENAKLIKPGGVGLELYVVFRVVESLGGSIWFESVENEGTAFYAKLPLKSKAKKGYKSLA